MYNAPCAYVVDTHFVLCWQASSHASKECNKQTQQNPPIHTKEHESRTKPDPGCRPGAATKVFKHVCMSEAGGRSGCGVCLAGPGGGSLGAIQRDGGTAGDRHPTLSMLVATKIGRAGNKNIAPVETAEPLSP